MITLLATSSLQLRMKYLIRYRIDECQKLEFSTKCWSLNFQCWRRHVNVEIIVINGETELDGGNQVKDYYESREYLSTEGVLAFICHLTTAIWEYFATKLTEPDLATEWENATSGLLRWKAKTSLNNDACNQHEWYRRQNVHPWSEVTSRNAAIMSFKCNNVAIASQLRFTSAHKVGLK